MPVIPQDEFEQILADQGLDQAQIRYVETLYHQALAVDDAAEWSHARAVRWLEDQASDFQVSAPPEASSSAATQAQDEQRRRSANAAAAARADADARRERTRRTSQIGFGMDQGPVADPGILSNSIAMGTWVNDQGQPIDPATGQITDAPVSVDGNSIWQMIRGQRFRSGELSWLHGPLPSDERVGLSGVYKAIGARRFITPSQALAILGSLDDNEILDIQRGLFEAGLYGEDGRPDWGVADPGTREAFIRLFTEASITPDMSLDQVLRRLAERNIATLGDVPGAPGSTSAAANIAPFQPEVASVASLSSLIDDISQELFGKAVTPEQKQALIAKLQSSEVGSQRQLYDQDVSVQRARMQTEGGPPGIEQIDTFMAAISGQESGGDYTIPNPDSGAYGRFQIMPANWGPWATRAGLGPSAPRTPENQEIVARRIMMDYYNQFGNWRDVAVAWYSGAGNVAAKRNSTRPQGKYPSISAYADQIMDRMAQLTTSGTGVPGATAAGDPGAFAPVERFDPAAEAEAMMRAQDPQGWAAHEFAQQAEQFYSLLGGVV